MVNNKRREIVLHDNSYDITKIEFSVDEVIIKINSRLLNKINRQNKRR